MIVYSKSCLACSHKTLWKKLKLFSQDHNFPIEERRIGLKTIWKEEAENYSVELPFIVHNGIAINLNEDLERVL